MPRFLGSFRITKVLEVGLSYEIQELDGLTTQIRAIGVFKPYTLRLQNDELEMYVSQPRNDQPISSIYFFDENDFPIKFSPSEQT